ncbi:MAG: hypothetical protein U0074_25665, partial [Kouleothrix sp.]
RPCGLSNWRSLRTSVAGCEPRPLPCQRARNLNSDAIHPSTLKRLRAPRAGYYPSNLLEYIEQR